MTRIAAFVFAAFICVPAIAQQPAPHTITLSDQQITGIIDAGTACLEKMPMACARYVLYIHDLVNQARQPKPEPKKDP